MNAALSPVRGPLQSGGSKLRRARMVELLLVGGATPLLYALSALLRRAVGEWNAEEATGFVFFYAAYVINDPHFTVTYLLFYRDIGARALAPTYSWAQRLRFIAAGFVVPALLTTWTIVALASRSAAVLGALIQTMFLLVGWHYVKQGFGVLSVLAARRSVRFSPAERVSFLATAFAGWAYAWASPADPGTLVEEKGVVYRTIVRQAWLERATHAVFLATLVPLAVLLLQRARRDGAGPLFVPVFAFLCTVFCWTIYTDIDPLVRYAIPALHSVQYLYFVYLWKGNEAREKEGPPRFERGRGTKLVALAFTAVSLGILSFHAGPTVMDDLLVGKHRKEMGDLGPTPWFAAIVACINIHHYFMDHVIWRRENPETRYLLADIRRAEPDGLASE